MTISLKSDDTKKTNAKGIASPIASSDQDPAGIRVTRADFARIMECSKQAVTDWVKSGRVIVGADGRIDPRQAVRSLLASGDPAKIRARVLAPLVAEMDNLRQRIAALESALSEETENAEFHESAANELNAIIEAAHLQLSLNWPDLQSVPRDAALVAIDCWMEAAREHGGDPEISMADFIDNEPGDNKRRPKYSDLDLLKIDL